MRGAWIGIVMLALAGCGRAAAPDLTTDARHPVAGGGTVRNGKLTLDFELGVGVRGNASAEGTRLEADVGKKP